MGLSKGNAGCEFGSRSEGDDGGDPFGGGEPWGASTGEATLEESFATSVGAESAVGIEAGILYHILRNLDVNDTFA